MNLAAGALRGQRVLVTGGSGFIGRHVVATLRQEGGEVRVVDLQAHPDPSVEVVRGDIADPEVIEAAYEGDFDGVVHLAAVTSVLRSIERPELTYQTNVYGTHRVLEGARAAGVRALVFASTNAVTGPMLDPAITERSSLRPLTPYGATKAAGEMLMALTNASWAGPVVIGAGRSLSVLDVIDEVRNVSGAGLPVTHGPARPGEVPVVIVDPGRAHDAGWSPQFDFSTGVAGVWEEWRDLAIAGALALPGTDAVKSGGESRRKAVAPAAANPKRSARHRG